MSLPELEQAVSALPHAQLTAFSKWFEEFLADEWDRQIERDILDGKLEAAGQRADADFKAGRCTPL